MITTELRRHDLVGNGTAGPFVYQFLIRDKTHLLVYVAGNLKTVDTHYTVSGVGGESGGFITFTTGNEPAASAAVILLGAEPYTQLTDYIDAGNFPAASHEEALDKLTRLVAQVKEQLTRIPTLSLPNHYNKSAISLGALVAGEFIRVNSLASGLEGATPTTVPSGLPVGGNYDHLVIDETGTVEWAQQVYNFSSGYLNISRYNNDLAAAVTAIGAVTKVNLVISTLLTVAGNVTVTSNITFDFRAAGGLDIATGITVGYAAGSFLVDDIRRPRFVGLGTFNASNLSEVIPDQWGADATGTTDSTTAIQNAISSLHSTTGGTLKLLSGTYDISDTISVDRPLTIVGQGLTQTVLNMTGSGANLQHGILSVDPSIWARDFTLKMETPLVANQQMHGIRMDLDGSGLTGNRYFHVEHVKVTGFNADVYCDGGASYAIQNGFYDHLDLQASGPAANYIGSCAYMNRVVNGYIGRNILDQNLTGEHAIYCYGCKNLTVEKNRIRNATRGEAQAIKVVGDGVVSSAEFGTWTIRDNDGEDCFNGILVELFGSETLGTLTIHGNKLKDITSTSATILGSIYVSVLGTSRIDLVSIRDNAMRVITQEAIMFAGAAGATIEHAIVDGLTLFDWSRQTPGSYVAIGAQGAGVVKLLSLAHIRANGNTTNGRTIWSTAGFGDWANLAVARLDVDYDTLEETLTVDGPHTPTLVPGDTTPALILGHVYIVNNTGATTVTGLDSLVPNRRYTLKHSNGNTTYTDSGTLPLAGSASWNPQNEDILHVRRIGSVVYEDGRSDNS